MNPSPGHNASASAEETFKAQTMNGANTEEAAAQRALDVTERVPQALTCNSQNVEIEGEESSGVRMEGSEEEHSVAAEKTSEPKETLIEDKPAEILEGILIGNPMDQSPKEVPKETPVETPEIPREAPADPEQDFPNDHYCSICLEGGDLICCEQCIHSFHTAHLPIQPSLKSDSDEWYCGMSGLICTQRKKQMDSSPGKASNRSLILNDSDYLGASRDIPKFGAFSKISIDGNVYTVGDVIRLAPTALGLIVNRIQGNFTKGIFSCTNRSFPLKDTQTYLRRFLTTLPEREYTFVIESIIRGDYVDPLLIKGRLWLYPVQVACSDEDIDEDELLDAGVSIVFNADHMDILVEEDRKEEQRAKKRMKHIFNLKTEVISRRKKKEAPNPERRKVKATRTSRREAPLTLPSPVVEQKVVREPKNVREEKRPLVDFSSAMDQYEIFVRDIENLERLRKRLKTCDAESVLVKLLEEKFDKQEEEIRKAIEKL